MLLLLFVIVNRAATEIDGIYYNLDSNSETAAVTSGANKYSGDVTIPATVVFDGVDYSVTSIVGWAFYNCNELTSIVVPNSVTNIGTYAFYLCSSLVSVTLSDNLTTINQYTFRGCSKLAQIDIPYGVTSIGEDAFYDCSALTSIEIPSSVTSIGSYAFGDCQSLASVNIPNSVTNIGSGAFWNSAWYNNQPDGLVYAGMVAYKYKGTMPSNTVIELKQGTLGITGSAFSNCSGLASITIPNMVKNIGNNAFSGCTGLTAVNIPNSVNSIGDDAFSRCKALTSITIPGSVKTIGNNAFYSCSGLTSAVIYDGVISLGNFVFAYCSNLSSITIPNSVESIGSYAFQNTPWLNSQSEGIVYVGKVAYMYKGYMPSNTSVVLKEGTTTLQSNTFERCSGLTSITIPSSLTNIGSNAFKDCTGLATIIVDGANSRYDSRENCNAIIETSNNSLIAGCKNTVIPNSVTSIGNNAFYNCSGLTSLTIPGGVTSIGSGAFNNCNGLVSIVVEAGNSKYDSRENCNAIIESSTNSLLVGCKNTVIPNSVTSIGENVFYNCSGLTSISIHSGMKSIGYCSICGCSDLTDVYCYAEKLPTTDKGTFDGVENNTVLHVPASAIETYRTTAPWSRFKEVVAIEETAIKHELSFDILADAKESYAVQNAVESENPIASYNAEAEANQAPEFFFNRPAYNAYSPEVRPYRVVYTWREGNPAIRGAGDNSTDAMIPEGDNTDVKDFFDFWYSANTEATAETNDDNDWVKFNEADKNGFLVPNVNTQSMRAAIKENVANRLIDGATYKVTMSIQRQDDENVWTTVNTYDIDITKVMPTAMPAEFGVRTLQLDNGVWPFYLRPYAGVEYGETAVNSPWKISWNDGDGQAPTEHDCRWGVDARPYDFKELFRGLILPEEDNIDKNYYFVFKESGNFAAADVDATEASDGQYKDADAIAVYTEDVDGGYYRLPKIHWSHLGESKNVEAGYIYRGISARLDETGKQFLAPQDAQTGLAIENQDYAIDPVPVMAGSKQLVASFSCTLDAAVAMTDDETKNIFEYNENVYCKATDAKFKLKNKYWYTSGYSQAYFNTQFPATWTDAEGGVGTLTDLIAAPYFSVDMTSLKCNVTSPAGYNYRDYYCEPFFAKSDGTEANTFNEIADICMKPRGNSPGLVNLKTNIEGTFTFGIYDIWFHSRTVTVKFKIKRPTNTPEEGIPGDIDGDGILSEDDMQTIMKYIQGFPLDDFDESAADVNNDHVVNILDVVMIIEQLKASEE